MRNALSAMVVTTTLLAAAQGVFAQTFPVKTVRLVIPFPVGGSSDANARILCRRSSRKKVAESAGIKPQ